MNLETYFLFCGGQQKPVLCIKYYDYIVLMPYTGVIKYNEIAIVFQSGNKHYYIDKYDFRLWEVPDYIELFGHAILISNNEIIIPSIGNHKRLILEKTKDHIIFQCVGYSCYHILYDNGYTAGMLSNEPINEIISSIKRYKGGPYQWPNFNITKDTRPPQFSDYLIPELSELYTIELHQIIKTARDELCKKIPRTLAMKIISYLRATDFSNEE